MKELQAAQPRLNSVAGLLAVLDDVQERCEKIHMRLESLRGRLSHLACVHDVDGERSLSSAFDALGFAVQHELNDLSRIINGSDIMPAAAPLSAVGSA